MARDVVPADASLNAAGQRVDYVEQFTLCGSPRERAHTRQAELWGMEAIDAYDLDHFIDAVRSTKLYRAIEGGRNTLGRRTRS